jgi:hypothetical protein
LSFYRAALRLRRTLPRADRIRWGSPPDDDVLVFDRPGLQCVVNMGSAAVAVTGEVLIASAATPSGELPSDCAVWVRTDDLWQDPAA